MSFCGMCGTKAEFEENSFCGRCGAPVESNSTTAAPAPLGAPVSSAQQCKICETCGFPWWLFSQRAPEMSCVSCHEFFDPDVRAARVGRKNTGGHYRVVGTPRKKPRFFYHGANHRPRIREINPAHEPFPMGVTELSLWTSYCEFKNKVAISWMYYTDVISIGTSRMTSRGAPHERHLIRVSISRPPPAGLVERELVLQSQDIQGLPEAMDYISDRVYARALPKYWAKLGAGDEIDFGSVKIAPQGIKDGSRTLTWNELEGIRNGHGGMYEVRQKGPPSLVWVALQADAILNFRVFSSMIRVILGQLTPGGSFY